MVEGLSPRSDGDKVMARTVGSSGRRTVAAIRRAGLRLIYKHGYEAMSLRQLAAEVGILQGSLYNHIRTKQDLLFELITFHMDDLLRALEEALRQDGTPTDRLKAFVGFHVDYHMTRKQEVFICYSELRSLTPRNFKAIVAMRQAYESRLIAILESGVADGSFSCGDCKVAAYGILSMLSGICGWFRPDGRLSRADIAELFTDMALKSVSSDTLRRKQRSDAVLPLTLKPSVGALATLRRHKAAR